MPFSMKVVASSPINISNMKSSSPVPSHLKDYLASLPEDQQNDAFNHRHSSATIVGTAGSPPKPKSILKSNTTPLSTKTPSVRFNTRPTTIVIPEGEVTVDDYDHRCSLPIKGASTAHELAVRAGIFPSPIPKVAKAPKQHTADLLVAKTRGPRKLAKAPKQDSADLVVPKTRKAWSGKTQFPQL